MAKGTGLIGNFKGKVGNTVGYKLSASNNGQTQGIRVYQPIVKNPKTSAQAEQRAKLAPINATYRALKMIIDRGNEGLPYGNKSRLAWLKKAFKSAEMPWFVKGATVIKPVGVQLTKGSLAGLVFSNTDNGIEIICSSVTNETAVNTVGAISTALKAGYPTLKDGDQVTFVVAGQASGALIAKVFSFMIDTTSTEALTGFSASSGTILYLDDDVYEGGAVIISREGANGEHLRSTTVLKLASSVTVDAPYDATSKEAAIESYMNSAAANSDWAEESIQ